jgi:tetratricopeptide (TPR) repeat protein
MSAHCRTRLLRIVICVLALGSAGCSRKTAPEQLVADSLFAAAKTVLADGGYGQAQALLQRALTFDISSGRGFRLAEEFRLLARAAEETAHFDTAVQYYSRATQEYRNLSQRDSIRSILLALSDLYQKMGQERKAFAQLDEGLRLARVFGDSAGVREIEVALLPLCRSLENWEMEGRIVNDLLKVYGAPPDPRMLARIYFEVARSQAFRREYERAAEHFLRAFTLADQGHDSLLAVQSLVRVAMAFDAAGRTTEAFQSFSDGLKRAGQTAGAAGLRAELLLRIGNAYLRARLIDQARRFYNAALMTAIQVSNKLLEGYCIVQLGVCEMVSLPDSALKRIASAVSLFQVYGYERGLSYAYDVLGAGLDRAGRYTEAVEAYAAAVRHFESIRSPLAWNEIAADCEASYHGRGMALPYDDAVDVLLRMGRQEEAFVVAERRQSWVLLSLLGRLELRSGDAAFAAALGEFRHAEAERIGAEGRLAEVLGGKAWNRELTGAIKRVVESAGRGVAAKADAVAALRPSFDPFVRVRGRSMEETQRNVPQGMLLVEYVPTRRSLYAFAVRSGRTTVQIAAVDREQLMSAARDLEGKMRRVEARGDSVSRVAAVPEPGSSELNRFLYEAFVRPVEADLRTSTKAVMVLPFELAGVPIHALRRASIPGTPYIGEQIAVSYLPAAGWLKPEVPAAFVVRDVVGIGYPGRTGWDVEYELRDIRAFYKDARLYFGSQASPGTLEQEHADVLHLALEVRYNAGAPGNAAVIVSDGKSADLSVQYSPGRFATLTAYRAVVVSSLSPGQANVHVVLASSLLAGGAMPVIVATSTPSRKAKKVFSEIFYTALLGGADAQTALRRVQAEMIRNPEFSSPLVWGSYMSWGQ